MSSPQPVPDKGTLGVPKDNPEHEARLRVRRIRDGLVAMADTVELIKTAYELRDWETLGYASWEKYLTSEFSAAAFPRLSKWQRQWLVEKLADTMSLRAVAVVLGVSKSTVANDLAQVSNSGQLPETEPTEPTEPTDPEDGAEVSLVPKVKGLDGRQHPKIKGGPKTGQQHREAQAARERLGWHPGDGWKHRRMQDMTKLLRAYGELPSPDPFVYSLLEQAADNLVKDATAFRDTVSIRLADMERAETA